MREGPYMTYRLSIFNRSVCEYEAPTTSPESRTVFFGEGSRLLSEFLPRQKGDADLKGPVSYARRLVGVWGIGLRCAG